MAATTDNNLGVLPTLALSLRLAREHVLLAIMLYLCDRGRIAHELDAEHLRAKCHAMSTEKSDTGRMPVQPTMHCHVGCILHRCLLHVLRL